LARKKLTFQEHFRLAKYTKQDHSQRCSELGLKHLYRWKYRFFVQLAWFLPKQIKVIKKKENEEEFNQSSTSIFWVGS